MKKGILPLFILMIFLALSCKEKPSSEKLTTSTIQEIPKLLERNEPLWHGNEWQQIQNMYGSYRASIVKNPKNYEAKLGMAAVFINEARVTGEHGHYYPAALQLTNEVLEDVDPAEKDIVFRALTTKASVELSQHEFEAALKAGQKAVQLNPYNADVYGALADAYVEMGQYEKAVEMADKMVSIRPDLRSYSRVSYLREIHGDIEGAIEAMKLAISAGYPGQEFTCWARLTLGELLEMYGQADEAAKQYRMALSERPDYPFAIAALGGLEMEKGNYEAAEKRLKEACKIIPEVGFYEDLAHLYKKMGRTEELAELKKEILLMLEDDVQSGHNMNMEYAAFYSELFEQPEKALEYVQKEWEKRPDNIDVNRMMASIYTQLGEKEKAAPHYEKATRTNSKHPELIDLKDQLAMKE